MNDRPKLGAPLREAPSEIDRFGGGGHERTAKELLRSIEHIRPEGGAVGLEGVWGSGKSSVVRIANRILAERPNISSTEEFLIVDLWAHQTERFRAAVVNSLLNYTQTKAPSLQPFVDQVQKSISTKTTDVETTASRRYSISAMYFIAIAPLLPIIAFFIGPYSMAGASSINLLGFDIYQAAVSAILLGYFLVFCRFLYLYLGHNYALLDALSQALLIFSKDTGNERTVKNTIETDELSTKFAEIVWNIVSTLDQSGRKITIVFDNIDRLPDPEIVKIWADIRLILSPPSYIDRKTPVVVIPYDRAHVLHALNSAHSAKSDVLAKTFNRILHVSTPVIYDWHRFLAKTIDDIISEKLDSNISYKLFKLYESHCIESEIVATPRGVIAFCNDVALLWEQWGHSIPILSIGLYVVNRSRLDDNPKITEEITRLEALAGVIGAGRDWLKHVAAITFNVAPEYAYQVLLQPELARGMSSPRVGNLQPLENVPGFGEVLVRTVTDMAPLWAASNAIQLSNAGSNAATLRTGGSYLADVWRELAQATESLSATDLNKSVSIAGLLSIYRNSGNRAMFVSRNIANWLSKSAESSTNSGVNVGREWARLIDDLLTATKLLTNLKAQRAFVAGLAVPTSQEAIIGIAEATYSTTTLKFSDLKISAGNELVDELLMNHLRSGSTDIWRPFQALRDRTSEAGLSLLVNKCIETIGDPLAVDNDVFRSLVEFVVQSKDSEVVRDIVVPALADGSLLRAAKDLAAADRTTQLALAWLLDVFTPSFSPTSSSPSEYSDELSKAAFSWLVDAVRLPIPAQDMDVLSDWVERAGKFADYLARFSGADPTEFVKSLVISMVERRRFRSLVVRDTFLQYPKVRSAVSEAVALAFLKRLADWSGRFEQTFSGFDYLSLSEELLLDINKTKARRLFWFYGQFDARVASLSTSDWLIALHGGSNLLDLIKARRSASGGYPKTAPYKKALLTLASEVLSGAAEAREGPDWRAVVNLLQPKSRMPFIAELYRAIDRKQFTQERWDSFYRTFGHTIVHMPLLDKPAHSIDCVVIPLAGSDEPASVKTAVALAPTVHALGMKASPSARRRLTRALAQNTKSHDPLVSSKARMLTEALANVMPAEDVEPSHSEE